MLEKQIIEQLILLLVFSLSFNVLFIFKIWRDNYD